jgi:hypothetical protein
MIQITAQMRVLVAIEPVDGRKGIDSLARLCQEKLAEDPFSGCVFVFRSRSGTAIRLLSYDGQEYWLTQKRLSKGEFSSPLEPFYGCDGCQSIAHTLLIEHARERVCGVIFQRCELRTQLVPPVFSRPKQASTDALIPVPAAYRDLSDVAIDHFSVHCIRRLFEAGVYESNDLAAEFCDEGHNLPARVRRMLPTLSVAHRYRL